MRRGVSAGLCMLEFQRRVGSNAREGTQCWPGEGKQVKNDSFLFPLFLYRLPAKKKWSRLKVCSLSLRSGLKTCVTQLQDPNQRHVVFLSQDPDQDLEVCSPFLDSRSLQIFQLTTKNSPHKSGMPANEEAETGGPQSPDLFGLQSEFYSGQCRETQCQSKKQRED